MSVKSTLTPFKYMKQFKAFAADWEYLTTLSDEGQLYCLSEQQVYAINVQLEYIGWLTRWYNTDDITQTTVERFKADIAEALMSCVDVTILIDQANANLITATVNKALQSQVLRDELEAIYDGNPTSINPNAPTADFGSSGDRYDALCAGLMAFVYQFARAQADSVRAGQVGGLAAIALIAALLIPGLNIFFLVGASIAVLIGLGTVGVTTEVAIQALTDTTALDNVVCCMRDAMRFDAVSQANFEASLSACSFSVGSNEQIIVDFIAPTLADNYLTILNILGQAYTGVIDGEQLPECPCEPPPAACLSGHYQDLRANNGGWTPYFSRGTWVSEQGWTVGALPTTFTRIGLWAVLTPHTTSIKVVTSGDVGEVRIYKSTGGVLQTLIGSDASPVISGGEYTYEIPTLTAYTGDEIMLDIGTSGNYTGVYLRSTCRNN